MLDETDCSLPQCYVSIVCFKNSKSIINGKTRSQAVRARVRKCLHDGPLKQQAASVKGLKLAHRHVVFHPSRVIASFWPIVRDPQIKAESWEGHAMAYNTLLINEEAKTLIFSAVTTTLTPFISISLL